MLIEQGNTIIGAVNQHGTILVHERYRRFLKESGISYDEEPVSFGNGKAVKVGNVTNGTVISITGEEVGTININTKEIKAASEESSLTVSIASGRIFAHDEPICKISEGTQNYGDISFNRRDFYNTAAAIGLLRRPLGLIKQQSNSLR